MADYPHGETPSYYTREGERVDFSRGSDLRLRLNRQPTAPAHGGRPGPEDR